MWTTKKILFFILHLLFTVVVPLILIIVQYSTLGNSAEEVAFALSSAGILLLLIVFYIFKRLFIDKRINALREQDNNLKADLKIEQDEEKSRAIVREIRKIRTTEIAVSAIIPILFFVLAIIATRAVGNSLIRLSGMLGFILISFCVGIIFNVLYSMQIRGRKNKRGKDGE